MLFISVGDIVMEQLSFDYVVIGAGPAGQKSAIQAAKLGKNVAVVEINIAPGGALSTQRNHSLKNHA